METLEARAELNQLKVHAREAPAADTNLMQFYAAGVTPPARPGDAVVLVAGSQTVLRRVVDVASEFVGGRALVRLATPPPLGHPARQGGRGNDAAADDAARRAGDLRTSVPLGPASNIRV